ncbi:MAG: hypothetical protein IPK83_04310 [Planctomycetes bacterium]|nr:hypothetical protein [Planctomycetota bacterium]
MKALLLEHEPLDRHGSIKVTAKIGDKLLDCRKIDILDPAARDEFAKTLHKKCQAVTRASANAELTKLAESATSTKKQKPKEVKQEDRAFLLAEKDRESERLLSETPEAVKRDADRMLRDPKLINTILKDVATCGVVGEEELSASLYIVGTSRMLTKPNSAITHGLSSTGKSYVEEQVSVLFPPEVVLKATDITANALYYLKPGSLIHAFVVNGERSRKQDDDRAEATRALREMLSAGELRKVVTDKSNGKLTTTMIWQPEPIAYVESTTLTNVFDEDQNRCLILATDESSEQTLAIITAAAKRAVTGVAKEVAEVVAIHHAAQRMLRRVNVRIPFAEELARHTPPTKPQARRAFEQALAMIRAVALLYQRQRSENTLMHGDTIDATINDYVIARRLLVGPLGRSLGGNLAPAVINLAKRLRERFRNDEFTSSEVTLHDGIITARSKANEYLNKLAEVGAVACVAEHKGNKPARWKLAGEIPENGADWLPTLEAFELCSPEQRGNSPEVEISLQTAGN